MNDKMSNTINTSLTILEIYTNALLDKAEESAEDPVEMEKNLRTLCVICSNLERIRRLQLDEPSDNFVN